MNPIIEFGFALANEIKAAVGMVYSRPIVDSNSISFVFKSKGVPISITPIVKRFKDAFEGRFRLSTDSLSPSLSTVIGVMGARNFGEVSIEGLEAVFNSGNSTLRINWDNMQLAKIQTRTEARLLTQSALTPTDIKREIKIMKEIQDLALERQDKNPSKTRKKQIEDKLQKLRDQKVTKYTLKQLENKLAKM